MSTPHNSSREAGLRMVRRATSWLAAGSVAGVAAVAGVVAVTKPGTSRTATTGTSATTGSTGSTGSTSTGTGAQGTTPTTVTSSDQQLTQTFAPPQNGPVGGGQATSGGS